MQLVQQLHQRLRGSLHHRCALVCGGCGGIAYSTRWVVVLHRPAQFGAFAIAQQRIVLGTIK